MARSLKLAAVAALFLVRLAWAQTPDIIEGQAPPAKYGSDTLAEATRLADHITVLEMARVDRKAGVIDYRTVATLKGQRRPKSERHLTGADDAQKRLLLNWARAGRKVVCFHNGSCRSVCIGNCWYAYDPGDKSEPLGAVVFAEPSTCYAGPVDRLTRDIKDLLAGKEVETTAVTIRGYDSLDLSPAPVERDWFHGKKGRGCRVRVRLTRKGVDFVGWGMTDAGGVPTLTAALKSKGALARAEAAVDLGDIGAPARAALPALRQALTDADVFVRIYAAEALGRIDPRAAPLAPLVRALKEKEPLARVAACAALAGLGRRAESALSPLVATLGDSDEKVRRAAAWALGEVGLPPSVPLPQRIKVAEGLGRLLRHDASPELRYWSARSLLKLGADAWAAAPALGAVLRENKLIARVAAHVLSRLDPPAVELLSAAYSDPRCEVRENIAELLGHLGSRARFALPALSKSPEQLASLAWGSAGRAVDRIDPTTLLPKEAFDGLVRSLGEPGARLWEATTVELIGQFLRESTAARDELRAVLKEGSVVAQVRAAVLLGRAGDATEAVACLVKLLDSTTADDRCRAAFGLALLGPHARAAIPELRRAARDRRDAVAGPARVALCLVGNREQSGRGNAQRRKALLGLLSAAGWDSGLTGAPFADSDFPGDMEALGTDSLRITEAAEGVLNLLADEDNPLPRLKGLLRAENIYRRAAAAVALCYLERDSSQAAPTLLAAFEERPSLLLFLADALSGLGSHAQALVPWLAQRLRHPNWAVYLAATKALRGIDPETAAEVWDLRVLRKSSRSPELRLLNGELEGYWHSLASLDAAEGYRTACRMVLVGEPAVAFLGGRLCPVVSVSREQLNRLLADLDSRRFRVRERAAAELEMLREAAAPALKEALQGRPSLEKRRRLEQLIARLDPSRSGVGMRLLRSVELLEQAGTPRAKEVLKALARGLPQARLTQEAKAALARLQDSPGSGR